MMIYDLLDKKFQECGMSTLYKNNMDIINTLIDKKELYADIDPTDKQIQNVVNNIVAYIISTCKMDDIFINLRDDINEMMLEIADAVEKSNNAAIYLSAIEYLAMSVTEFNILMLERMAVTKYKNESIDIKGFEMGVKYAIERMNALRDHNKISDKDKTEINKIIIYYFETILNNLKVSIGEEDKKHQYKFICAPGNA